MGLLGKIKNNNTNDKSGEVSNASLDLSKQELEIILTGLGEASFKGRQLEVLYKLVIKLQQAHQKL
jgi:hypothetical protein